MREIKPKKTVYRGHTYRSMAEAKTAEALDRLGLSFEYECAAARGPQYIGGQYTPDFWVPGLNAYLEVAGVWDERHEHNSAAFIRDANLYRYNDFEDVEGTRFFRIDGDGYVIPIWEDGEACHIDGFINRCSKCGGLSLMGNDGPWNCPHCGAWDGDHFLVTIGDNLFDAAGVKRYGGR